MKSLLDQM